MNVTGNVSLLSGSNLLFQLAGVNQGSQYGFLNVTGNVSLGGNLNVSLLGNFTPSNATNFTVLSSTTALTGAFANVANNGLLVTTDNSGAFTVSYNGNNVVLSTSSPIARPGPGRAAGLANSAVSEMTPPQKAIAVVRLLSDSRGEIGETTYAVRHVGKVSSDKINLKNSDQLLDLLEGAEPTETKGKVAVSNSRMTKGASRSGSNVASMRSSRRDGLGANAKADLGHRDAQPRLTLPSRSAN